MTEEDRSAITDTWRGWPRYRCRLCPFDTLEEPKFIDHMIGAHPLLEVIDGGKAAPVVEPVAEPVAEAPVKPGKEK